MSEKPKKLSTDPYKGVRDFYPADMAVQEYIFGVWKKAAESFGYERYDASVLEPADLYKAKSGEEIVNEQTYTFTDRGDREVTLRPEMTPTAARMVAARKRELGLPLRWYSIPNLFRYEAPQRGRVREHWQLNVDLFGVDSIEADIEIVTLAGRIMEDFGAKKDKFLIRVSYAGIFIKVLSDKLGFNKDISYAIMKTYDRYFEKTSENELQDHISKILKADDLLRFNAFIDQMKKDGAAAFHEYEEWQRVMKIVQTIHDKYKYSIRGNFFLTRGFEYYTGVIFEVYDGDSTDIISKINRRSLFGGGRYDDLTSLFGGDKIPAVGFGMGDVTMRDFLETHGLPTKKKDSMTDTHICTLDLRFIANAEELATKLRAQGKNVSVNLTAKKVGDQIAYADKHGIPSVIVIGEEEVKSGVYKIKDLKSGTEADLKL